METIYKVDGKCHILLVRSVMNNSLSKSIVRETPFVVQLRVRPFPEPIEHFELDDRLFKAFVTIDEVTEPLVDLMIELSPMLSKLSPDMIHFLKTLPKDLIKYVAEDV